MIVREIEMVDEDESPETTLLHLDIRMKCLQLALAHSTHTNNLGITTPDTALEAAEKFYSFISGLEKVETFTMN